MTDQVQAVLFDVDGTLVDSNYLHAVTWWEAFAQAGHDVPMARIHRAIGMGSDQLLDSLLPATRDRDADSTISTAEAALYSVYWRRLRPLPGARELLRACRKHRLRVVLASSANPRELAILRAALDADDAIDDATSAGDADRSKPAPDLVEIALERAGVDPDQAVSSAIPSGTSRPASGQGSRASAYLPAASASLSFATPVPAVSTHH
jgi:beta-phosphoglucomutase-like phosphatase (HAD superfamily)